MATSTEYGLARSGARGRPQPRTDLADEAPGAGLSHHCQVPPGQLAGAQGFEPGVRVPLRKLGLVAGEVVAIDGAFFDGNASKASIKTQRKLARRLAEIEQEIEAYGAALEANDHAEA